MTPGTTYYYTVRAVGADGTAGPWSDQKFVTVPGSTQPLAAPTLTAQPTMAVAVELRWNSVSGAVRYELWAWGQRRRLAAAGRRQPDRHVAHAHTAFSRHDLLLLNSRSGRQRRNQCVVTVRRSDRVLAAEPHSNDYHYTYTYNYHYIYHYTYSNRHTNGHCHPDGYRYSESYCHPDSDFTGPGSGCRESRPGGALPGNRWRQLDE